MTTEGERAALAQEFTNWHVWRWNGLIYARRLMVSPPETLRDVTADDLRQQIIAAENARRD